MIRIVTLFALMCFSQLLQAQYCAPAVTNNGLYITNVAFDYGNSIGSPVNSVTGNTSYTQYTGYSSGTVIPCQSYSLWLNVQTPSSITFNVKGYADWNNDGDFTDTYEQLLDASYTTGGNIGFSTGFSVPLIALAGNRRIRFIVTTGSASPCAAVSGEVEDYLITVGPNYAPVLNTSATTSINKITSDASTNDGVSILAFLQSSEPAATLISDANDYGSGFNTQVPRGIAISGVSAANGTWQYKVGAGAWTNFGAVAVGNALHLLADAYSTRYQSNTRIRFVPSSTGTASFTYYAWDGSNGVSGSYANIASTGNATAYSTATSTGSITVVAPTNYAGQNVLLGSDNNKISTGLIDKSTGTIVNVQSLLEGTDYAALDMEMDVPNTTMYWVAGDYATINHSSYTGTGLVHVSPTHAGGWLTGLAVGGGNVFYIDGGTGINKMNPDGSSDVSICNGVGQLQLTDLGGSGDIDYDGGNLYFEYYSNASSKYTLAKTDASGNGFTILYASTNTACYLAVANGYVYFPEQGADGTGYLKKIATTGGAATTLVTASNRYIDAVFVDAYSSIVYYTEGDPNNLTGPTHIRRVATTGGASTFVATVDNRIPSFAFDPASAPLPVELTSFTAGRSGSSITLRWRTATEMNNFGFDVERRDKSSDGMNIEWKKIGFVPGHGTSAAPLEYSFSDNGAAGSAFVYRLKQIDNNGKFTYSSEVEGAVEVPRVFSLSQNFPNPFNPSTTIEFTIPNDDHVSLKVFNLLGDEVASLIDAKLQAGTRHRVEFNASQLSSGVYFYRLQSGGSMQMKKLLLLR